MHDLIAVFKNKILYDTLIVSLLLYIFLSGAIGTTCMEPYFPTTDSIKICPLKVLPKEILNHIASFLIFPNRETDEELHNRLKFRLLRTRTTVNGKLIIPDCGSYALSQDCSYYVYHDFNKKSGAHHFCATDLINKGKFKWFIGYGKFYESYVAISNSGNYIAYKVPGRKPIIKIFQVASKNVVAEITFQGFIKNLDFNKQSTRLGILLKKNKCIFTSISKNESNVFHKSLHDYFLLKGVCKSLTQQLAFGNTYYTLFDIE